jgi:predicted ATPase
MPDPGAGSVVGREAELAAVDAALEAARSSLAALVLEGEPGIGKTTVWREGLARAAGRGFRVLACRAAQAEARLSFAALGDLLAPLEAAALASLPGPQRRALEAALLRAEPEGAAPDPRAIGTGVVSLITALAATAPVLLALDDVQWLDLPSARALEFALRRLESRPVVVLATLRTGEPVGRAPLLPALPAERVRRVVLGSLSLGALYRVLEQQLGHGLPRPLLVRVQAATGGNPFYALEIVRAIQAEGPPAPGQALPIPRDLRELAAARLRRLPTRAREALLRASALAQPTVALVDPDDLAPAEQAGVVRIRPGGRVDFAHPLFAAAIYAAASRERRRRLHGELAQAASDVEERARHLMLAGDGPDEQIAAALDEAAARAHRRGARCGSVAPRGRVRDAAPGADLR